MQPCTQLRHALETLAKGDFEVATESMEARDAALVSDLTRNLRELTDRCAYLREGVGEGDLRRRLDCDQRPGSWGVIDENLNQIYGGMALQLLEVKRMVKARADGDFATKADFGSTGEVAELGDMINALGVQLFRIQSEMARVAHDLGTAGRFGGQMEVANLSGGWQELVESFNTMAASLTLQIREIANITREVASGSPVRRVTVAAQGETRDLKEDLNVIMATV